LPKQDETFAHQGRIANAPQQRKDKKYLPKQNLDSEQMGLDLQVANQLWQISLRPRKDCQFLPLKEMILIGEFHLEEEA
jgi:hypothetical protein